MGKRGSTGDRAARLGSAKTWPLRPFDPECGDRTPIDDKTIRAIQLVICDWDARNWDAVRAVLDLKGYPPVRIKEMKCFDVQMAFMLGAKSIVDELKGPSGTTQDLDVIIPGSACDPHAPYMPARWFKDKFGLTPNALQKRVKRKQLRRQKVGPLHLYSVPGAKRLWPDEVTHGPNGNG